jgi:cell wall-associated protease
MKKFLFLLIIFINCKTKKTNHSDNLIISNDSVFWQNKDLSMDSIPGISLDKWYAENKD